MTLTEIKQTLEQHKLRPLKSLGQNFLTDLNLCRQLVQFLNPTHYQNLMEVGPGLGALTSLLLETKIPLTALEIDKGLCSYLSHKFQNHPHFTLIPGDALDTIKTVPPPQALIGNLPYNISTPFIATVLQLSQLPQRCIFMLQKEVGERMEAQTKTKAYGAISIYVQTFYDVKVLNRLSPQVFYPSPKVDSIVVQMEKKKEIPFSSSEGLKFYRLLRRGFSQRRKKLKNTLPIPLEERPDAITVEEWQNIFLSLHST